MNKIRENNKDTEQKHENIIEDVAKINGTKEGIEKNKEGNDKEESDSVYDGSEDEMVDVEGVELLGDQLDQLILKVYVSVSVSLSLSLSD